MNAPRHLHVLQGEASLGERADAAMARMRARLASDCPGCTDASSSTARACPQRLEKAPVPELTGAQAFCKHTDPSERTAAEQRVTDQRRRRLDAAGFSDPRAVQLVPKVRGFPLPPQLEVRERPAYQAGADALAGWITRPDKLLVALLGGTGAGKTFWAGCAIAGWARSSFLLEANVVDRPQKWDRLADRAETADLLVLDDLGLERTTESRWGRDTLGALLQLRINHDRPTVVTGNLVRTDLWQLYGGTYPDRLKSRLEADARTIPLGVVDIRRRLTEKRP